VEIVYDGTGTRVMLRKDDGTEVDLLKLEGALTMAQTSREFNRGRVVKLEDKLERIAAILAEGRGSDDDTYVSVQEIEERDTENRMAPAWAVTRFLNAEAELESVRRTASENHGIQRREIERLENQVREYDRDRHTERDRADDLKARLARLDGANRKYTAEEVGHLQATESELVARPLRDRIADLERQLSRSIERENKLENDAAEEREIHRRSLAARDSLLETATRRLGAARDILSTGSVADIRDNIVTSKGAILADAIGNALRVLDA
jgi:hypothetical protein